MSQISNSNISIASWVYDDALHHILQYLVLHEFATVSRVSHRWRASTRKTQPRSVTLILFTPHALEMNIKNPMYRHVTELRTVLNATDAYISIVADIIKSFPRLSTLDMSGGIIGQKQADLVAGAIQQSKNLTSINLSNGDIGYYFNSSIPKSILYCSTLTSVDLCGNRLQISDLEILAQDMRQSTNLAWMYLSSNRINDQGAMIIADALRINKSLIQIDLSDNRIKDTGVAALKTLVEFNMICNPTHSGWMTSSTLRLTRI